MLIKRDFFKLKASELAPKLLGKIIEYSSLKGMITETEAYEDDEASHAFKRTKRSEIMYSSYGKIYVYFVYGNYYCLNFTCYNKGPGAVLIRALKPIKGISLMKKRRNCNNINNLLNGPGKLCQAFNINKGLNNTEINDKIKLFDNKTNFQIFEDKRIGIKKATHLNWRFYIK
jgi:DNA-3-methyladenine glycosylase